MPVDEALLRLLDFHGRKYWLVNGWSMRFHIVRIEERAEYPAGIKYSLTLHEQTGERILGFDNSGSSGLGTVNDHWHPFQRAREHIRYEFVSTDKLLVDFFTAVENACQRAGVPLEYAPDETELDFDEEDDNGTQENR